MLLILVGALGTVDLKGTICGMKRPFKPENQTYPFTLPTLPYSEYYLGGALPALLVQIHHQRHQQGYVNKLNEYLERNSELQRFRMEELVYMGKDDVALARMAGGDYNHYLYWWVLKNPLCASAPTGPLLKKINEKWGSFNSFKEEFSDKAKSLFGSGWTWLCAAQEELFIVNTENHVNPLMTEEKCYSILANDVWEHAYYLKYQWDRASYVDIFWSLVDWRLVELFYEKYASRALPVPF